MLRVPLPVYVGVLLPASARWSTTSCLNWITTDWLESSYIIFHHELVHAEPKNQLTDRNHYFLHHHQSSNFDKVDPEIENINQQLWIQDK